jgi:branched-chain amino acid transport system substrate-binding protein
METPMPLSISVRLSTVVALAASGLLAACGNGVPSTLKIGAAEPLSGPSAARGQDVVNGMKLAAQELNASGYKVDGKPVTIEIVAVDDKADKDTAKKVAQDLVDQKVVAVVGDLSSDVTEATIPVYKGGDVPQLFTSTATNLMAKGEGNTFRLVANDTLQAQAIAGFLNESLKAKNVALVYEDSVFGSPIAKDVAAALTAQGKTLTVNQAVTRDMSNFAPFVEQLKATPPDVLIAVLRDQQLVPLFAQLSAAQLAKTPIIVTGSAKTDKLLHASPEVQSLYLTSSIVDAVDSNTGKTFLKNFGNVYKSEPIWAAHYGYDAVYVLADAVQHARSVKPKDMRETLRTLDANAPVTSSIRFAESGEQRFAAITVYQRNGGLWTSLMRSDKW